MDNPAPDRTEPTPKVKRKTYGQAWEQYNAAATNEKFHFQELLADLCGSVEEPVAPGRVGRPPIPLADQIFAAVFKVYSTVSGRRFMCDLEDAARARPRRPVAALQQRLPGAGEPGHPAHPR